MQLKETPVCPKTAEKPDFIESAWMCKESGLEMRFEDDQLVCDQCVGGSGKAGRPQQVHKPQPMSKSELEEGKRRALEEFEKQKREIEKDLERDRKNYPRRR